MDNHSLQLQKELTAIRAVLGTYEAEKSKMIGLLQDNLTQYLSALKMNILALESFVPVEQKEPKYLLGKIKELLDESFIGIKKVTRFENFRTPLSIGLPNALNLYVRHIDQRMANINYYIDYPVNTFDQFREVLIFRVVQELINNALLHSGATHLDITVQSDQEGVSVIVEDDGCGFNLLNTDIKGKGIDFLLCRMDYLKGTIEWSSSKLGGTIVAIHIPLH